jgi:hypothetical protein
MGRTRDRGGSKTGGAFRAQQALKARVKTARDELARLKEAREVEVKAAREKREEKQRRRAENQLKGASYQVVRAREIAAGALEREVLWRCAPSSWCPPSLLPPSHRVCRSLTLRS